MFSKFILVIKEQNNARGEILEHLKENLEMSIESFDKIYDNAMAENTVYYDQDP